MRNRKRSKDPETVKETEKKLEAMKQNNDEIIRQKTIQLMVATSCAAPVGSDGKVFMLEHNGCGTTNSVKTQDPVTMGGKFIFDKPPDQKLNPGEHFSYEITAGGEECYFDSDVWDNTKRPLMRALKDSGKWGGPGVSPWYDCLVNASPTEMLGLIMDPALDAFYEWNIEIVEVEGLVRETSESEVAAGLAKTFKVFQREFQKMHQYHLDELLHGGEHTKHFKIYPTNSILDQYLRGDCSSVGRELRATAVYPRHLAENQVGNDADVEVVVTDSDNHEVGNDSESDS